MAEITREIELNRVRMAHEAYVELKALHSNGSLSSLLPPGLGEDKDEVDSTLPDWPTFRDGFIKDWAADRIILTVKEADAMFDKDVNEALDVIEQTEAEVLNTSTPAVAVPTATPEPTATQVTTPAVAPKRRGRPPGKATRKAGPEARRYTASKRTATRTKNLKVAAKKKSAGKTSSSVAQTIIERYQARDWSRKDILQKLQSQVGVGAAYAATLYQKFAK